MEMIKIIKKIKKVFLKELFLIIIFIALFSSQSKTAYAEPTGPEITILGNTTKASATGSKVNTTINGTKTAGGYIFTMFLDSRQQNKRWKAYVGNVTGTLALDDVNSNTLYQWSLTTVIGEVYTTRTSGTINWSNINCTWVPEGVTDASSALRIVEEHENHNLSHTNKDDNITATFDKTNHSLIDIGGVRIGKDECFSVQTWQKDAQQVFSDSDDANFTQVILWDGSTTDNGNVVYVTDIGDDITGYDSSETYDFQMLVPENGASTWSSSIAYYFYVELA